MAQQSRATVASLYREFQTRFRTWADANTTPEEWAAWRVYWGAAFGFVGVLSLVVLVIACGEAQSIKEDQSRVTMRDAAMMRLDRNIDILCARLSTAMPRRTAAPEPPSFALNPFADALPESCSNAESTRP